jgi:hypothetical protein
VILRAARGAPRLPGGGGSTGQGREEGFGPWGRAWGERGRPSTSAAPGKLRVASLPAASVAHRGDGGRARPGDHRTPHPRGWGKCARPACIGRVRRCSVSNPPGSTDALSGGWRKHQGRHDLEERPSLSSTALSPRSASSAATDPRGGVGPAPMRSSLAAASGEARPVASARPGSGRSRFAALRRRIRLEAPAQAKAAIRPHDSVRTSSPTSLWKLWKLRLWNRRRTLAFKRRGRTTLRRSARCGVTRKGEVRKKARKERELLQRLQGCPSPSDGYLQSTRNGAAAWPRFESPVRESRR